MFPICSFYAKRVKRILTEGLPERKRSDRHLGRRGPQAADFGREQRRLSIPLPDESQDAVTFHELPPKVRRIVLSEFARVLKPGRRLVLVDSLQHGDEPDYDGLSCCERLFNAATIASRVAGFGVLTRTGSVDIFPEALRTAALR